jgi:hypothetical protein
VLAGTWAFMLLSRMDLLRCAWSWRGGEVLAAGPFVASMSDVGQFWDCTIRGALRCAVLVNLMHAGDVGPTPLSLLNAWLRSLRLPPADPCRPTLASPTSCASLLSPTSRQQATVGLVRPCAMTTFMR